MRGLPAVASIQAGWFRPIGGGGIDQTRVVPESPATDAEWLKRPGLSAALIAIALIELLWALADLPNLFGGVSNLFGDVPRSALAVPGSPRRVLFAIRCWQSRRWYWRRPEGYAMRSSRWVASSS